MILLDWRYLALYSTAILLFLGIMDKKLYKKLFTGIHFKLPLVLLAILGITLLIAREIEANPFSWIQQTWAPLSFWGQLIVYNDTIHARSILFFGVLAIALWRKYDSIVPALAVTWFCLGIVEITFIAQHYIGMMGRFIGWDWYLPFFMITLLFLTEWRQFRFQRKFYYFFAAAVFVQYFLLIWRPYGLSIFIPSIGAWPVINTAVLPVPPGETWWFEFLNHFMKTLFAIAFYFVEWKKNAE